MARQNRSEDTLFGLAKQWLKTMLFGRRRDADILQNRIERRAREEAGRAVVEAVMPTSWKRKMADLSRQSEERREEAARRQRAEHAARPRASLTADFSGDVTGQLSTPVPVDLHRPEEPGDALWIDLTPLDPLDLNGHVFHGLQLSIPAYTGPGTYDLAAMSAREELDPSWSADCPLLIDTTDEPLYWSPDYGPAVVTVEPDERTIHVQMAMEDAGSRHVDYRATIVLP